MSSKKKDGTFDAESEIVGVGAAEAATDPISRFSKDQLLASKRFSGRKDLLNAVLSEKEVYTAAEAEEKINKFLKGRVK